MDPYELENWPEERAALVADIEARRARREAGLEPLWHLVPLDFQPPAREPTPVVTKSARQPAPAPAPVPSGVSRAWVNRQIASLADAMGKVLADERRAHADTVRDLRIENARLLSRLLELEAKGRATDDATVIDARQLLARRRAAA